MAYFTPHFIEFFKELAKNNNREWFTAHKKEYETHVKKPFQQFVQDIISHISSIDPDVTIAPADAISRINRDIRFSQDKTPYNLHVSAIISAKGKKDKGYPGIFIQLNPEAIQIWGGAYAVENENLYKIRKFIAENPSQLKEALNDREFKNNFGKIEGDFSKRLPEEFKAAAKEEPLVANKQFYFKMQLKADAIYSDNLLEQVVHIYKAAKPVNDLLKKAINE